MELFFFCFCNAINTNQLKTMKQPNLCGSSRSFFFFLCCFLLLVLLLLLLLVPPSSSSSSSSSHGADDHDHHDGQDHDLHHHDDAEKVTMSVYYETLCPYCAEFIVNHVGRMFQMGLISIVNLRMLPWGNAIIKPDGSFVCQHGDEECFLNTIEACTVKIYPDVEKHFRLIHCVERVTLEGRQNEWANCFQMSGMDTSPINCYTNGNGKSIEQYFAKETAQLNPPIRFVPWVVVNNQPLQEDYQNFMKYICDAFKGNPKPDACATLSTATIASESNHHINSFLPVCYVDDQTQNLTSPLKSP